MFKVKHKGLFLILFSFLALLITYFYATWKSITNSFNLTIIGNTYVSVNLDFSYEFIDDVTLTKYTAQSSGNQTYKYEDGIFFITENDKELQAVLLNKGEALYIETSNTYMYLLK